MTINLSVPQTMQELRPRITVVGVGGAGCNAVNNMISADLDGVDFLVANTDGQALAHSLASRKIQLGSAITQGLGAGSKPEIGQAAAEESLEDVMAELADCNMVFITAGMGGGTGTGAAPIIARAARERGILTVGVITKPFEFEGQRRMAQAEEGIEELQAHVDTLIVIPNQNLFRLANERTTFADAFHMADTVLHQGVCGVTDLMIKPGMINLDFADIRAVMGEMGKAMMGTGESSGDSRAIDAAEAAINNPLLDDTTMKGAHAVLINVTGGMDMTLFEVDEAANRIRKEVDPDAVIIFGSAFDEKLEGIMRVSVVATGIDTQTGVMARPVQALRKATATVPPRTSTIITPQTISAGTPEPVGDTEPDEANGDRQIDITKAVAAANEPSGEASGKTDVEEVSAMHTTGNDEAPKDTVSATEPNILTQASDTIDSEMDASETPGTAISQSETPSEEKADIMTKPLVVDKADDLLLPKTPAKQTAFIPPAAAKLPEEESVPATGEATTSRPSLINKISGLWSQKPNSGTASKPAPDLASEKASGSAERTGSILDLPRVDMVQHGTDDSAIASNKHKTSGGAPGGSSSGSPNGIQGTLDNAGDDLDIPAFLRRQAN